MLKETIEKTVTNTIKQYFPWLVKPSIVIASVAGRMDADVYNYTLRVLKNNQSDAGYPMMSSKSKTKYEVGSNVVVSMVEDKPVIVGEVI